MLKVKNMISARSGRVVANQFSISRFNEAGEAVEHVFQSYESECGVDADGERLVHVEIKCAPADLPYLNELLMESAW